MNILAQKKCTKCKTWKDKEWFSKHSKGKDGLNSWCKQCNNENSSRWYEANVDRVSEKARKYYEANTDKIRESHRKWRKENSDKKHEYDSKWREENTEYFREYKRNWWQANPDKKRAHSNNRRARKAGNGGSFTAEEWRDLCNKYDNQCLCCGEQKKLTADHVIPLVKGGTSNIDNIQPLCRSCNASKGTKTIDFRGKT